MPWHACKALCWFHTGGLCYKQYNIKNMVLCEPAFCTAIVVLFQGKYCHISSMIQYALVILKNFTTCWRELLDSSVCCYTPSLRTYCSLRTNSILGAPHPCIHCAHKMLDSSNGPLTNRIQPWILARCLQ